MITASSNKLLIILISLLILIIIGGAAGFIFYIDKEDKVASTTQEKQLATESSTTQKESLSEIGPLYPIAPITVNLKNSADKDVYLKISLSLELSNKLLANELDAKNAVIRDNIILLLSAKSIDDISSEVAKVKLCEEIKTKLNSLLDDGYIKNVYIISFIIE